MKIADLLTYFITGGLFTVFIVVLEERGQRTLSGLATLMPVFTLVAYFFIGERAGGAAVGQHAKWVLAGTLVSWVPYMLTVAYFAPSAGPKRAILAGLTVFLVLALLYVGVTARYKVFQ